MFYTVDGQAGFTLFNPATCPGCTFNIHANFRAAVLTIVVFSPSWLVDPAVRDPSAWYVSTTPMAMPHIIRVRYSICGASSTIRPPAIGIILTIDPTNLVAPVVGGPAGSLAGLFIKGVGILHSVTNPASDFSSWNYAGYTITAFPSRRLSFCLQLR